MENGGAKDERKVVSRSVDDPESVVESRGFTLYNFGRKWATVN
jgi:hypothetical protein